MSNSKHQTAAQRVVEAYYAVHRAGAMRFRGHWLWLDQIRNDPALAVAFIKDRSEGYRDSEMLRAWLAPIRGRAN